MSKTSEKIEVMQAFEDGRVIEAIQYASWVPVPEPKWNWDMADYRIKPTTKPSINWDHLAPEVEFICTDPNGVSKAFENKPYISSTHSVQWVGKGGHAIKGLAHLASYLPGDCDWKDSLVQRPVKDEVKMEWTTSDPRNAFQGVNGDKVYRSLNELWVSVLDGVVIHREHPSPDAAKAMCELHSICGYTRRDAA